MSKDLDKKDLFTDKVKDKLEGYELTPDPAVWAAVQAGLNESRRKKRIMPVWWISTGMAAAVALLFVLNLTLQHSELSDNTLSQSNVNVSDQPALKEKSVSKTVGALSNSSQTSPAVETLPSKTANVSKGSTSFAGVLPQQSDNRVDVNVFDGEENNKGVAVLTDSVYDQDTKIPVATNVTADSETKKTDANKDTALPDLKKDWEDPLKKKQKGDWEMLAMVGASQQLGGAERGNINTFSGLRDGVFQAASGLNNLEDLFPEFDDKTYFAPLTVGVAVSKMLTRTVFIETGLRYTYLHSQFRNSLSVANLHLHYVGVPLNVGYRINTNKNWYIYTSGGIMAEKGLSSVYHQTIRYSNNTISTSKTESIDGMQWSVNATVGLGYNLSRKFSLYFEPEFGYYFDNNQPVSSRTENQVTFGLKAGLRFHL